VHLVRQGVDHDAFASAASAPPPPSMATIAGPRVGSVGNLNDRVDWTLVEGIARSRPGWNVVLVGPIYQAGPRTLEALPRLRLLPNVHLLPEVPPGDLPGMVAHLDVGLIIYAPGPGTLAINPLKLYQYLAAGRAVVSTPLPSVEEFRGTVAIARTVEEFVAAIEAALAPPEAAPAAARARRVLEFDWEQVAALRLELLHDALRARGRPAPDAPGR
jgi:glycosyltransferase involved in cell wall biosynthesis